MLSGKRNSRQAEGERMLEPILVDYFTRDGSTLTMRLLATSPQIAVGGQYPYEHKYFAYLYRWARLLERREWPRDFWSGAHLASLVQEDYLPFLGPPPWIPRDLLEPNEGGEGISDYSFRAVWAEFSRRAVAHTSEQGDAEGGEVRYYAEKHLDTWKVKLNDLPSVRLLALLRDPRDTYLSIMGFRRKRQEAGQRGFAMGRGPAESDDAWVGRYVHRQKERLRWINTALQEGAMPVFRYDDMVLDLPGQARRLEDWLGISLDPAAVAKDDRLNVHVSADTPESSIGRWRTEMPAELAKRFHEELGDELQALGFEVPGPRLSPRPPTTAPTGAGKGGPARPSGPLEALENVRQGQNEALTAASLERARLGAALEAAAMEKARLKRELHETEQWLRSLERSRSWQITRPIRAAGAAFRKLSRWRTASPRRGV
jgi:hypothetical protein